MYFLPQTKYLGKTGEVKQLLGDGLVAVQIDSEPVVLSDAVLTPVKDDSMLQLSQAGLPSSEAARLRMEEVKRLVESGKLKIFPLLRRSRTV